MTTTLHRYEPAIDVEDLVSRCLGNIAFADRLLGLLTSQCDVEIEQLEIALAQNKLDDVCRITHRLKGALANASAKQLSMLADSICNSAREHKIEQTLQSVRELRDQWDDLLARAGM